MFGHRVARSLRKSNEAWIPVFGPVGSAIFGIGIILLMVAVLVTIIFSVGLVSGWWGA